VSASLAVTAVMLEGTVAHASNTFLYGGQTLYSGQSISNGTGCTLVVQSGDGNLVEYCNGSVHWHAHTYAYPGDFFAMQTDGNAVVYTSGGQPIWTTDTNGYNGAHLVLQDDQNIVLYSANGSAVWAASWEHSAAGAQIYAQAIFYHYGWSVSSQWGCLYNLWQRESNWNWSATNSSSGAYGIPQALPASKMATAGTDWQIGGLTQVHWGEDYISQRYGTPCVAWTHEQQFNWY
jgi:hypothetical protein